MPRNEIAEPYVNTTKNYKTYMLHGRWVSFIENIIRKFSEGRYFFFAEEADLEAPEPE